MSSDDALAGWRKQIDELDDQLLALFAQRTHLVNAIGKHKTQTGLPAHDPERFETLLARLKQKAREHHLSETLIEALWSRIHTDARISQMRQTDEEYIFARLNKKVAEVEARAGRPVLSFGAGSPDVPPSPVYLEKLTEFFHDKKGHMYPPYGATLEFAEALKYWYKKRFDVQLDESHILPLLGAKDGIAHLPLALLAPGDEILAPDPGYPGFTGPTLAVGALPVYYDLPASDDIPLDLNELSKKVTKKTKYLWANFPSNPTGRVTTMEELARLVAFARANNICVIYDNAYSEITFDGYVAPSILQVTGAQEVVVEIGSFSKTFSFAGYRMGWIVGNQKIIDVLAKVKTQFDSGMALPLQRLGTYALVHQDKTWHAAMIASYAKRRHIIATHLATLGLTIAKPKGSLYLWCKIPDVAPDANTYSNQLLEEKQILLTPGTAFGANGKRFVRASICVNIDCIEEYFS